MSIKIHRNKLDTKYFNTDDYFGEWTKKIDFLKDKFISAKPFEHVIIDNFLKQNVIDNIEDKFPNNYENWYYYNNPLEKKYAYDEIENLDISIQDIFYLLSTNKVINLFKKISGIENLEYDEYLHGAGLHAHPRDGKLAIHLDYEKHPITGKERRLNLILYLNKFWEKHWNGETEFWNNDVSECVTKSPIKFNSCLIFKTNDISWHGLPTAINCPNTVFRKTLAYYYISPLDNLESKKKYREKATYTLLPNDDKNEYLLNLINIRSKRRLKEDDLI